MLVQMRTISCTDDKEDHFALVPKGPMLRSYPERGLAVHVPIKHLASLMPRKIFRFILPGIGLRSCPGDTMFDCLLPRECTGQRRVLREYTSLLIQSILLRSCL